MELPLKRETEGFENNLWKGFCRTEGVVKTIDKEEFEKQKAKSSQCSYAVLSARMHWEGTPSCNIEPHHL